MDPRLKRALRISGFGLVLMVGLWACASLWEMATGLRLLPWSEYVSCGNSNPAALPMTVRVGFYEEFPNSWRLDKLRDVDFPVELAIAATSRAEFQDLQSSIRQNYKQVRDVLFWPLLSPGEGYYPGTWSDPEAVRRVATEAEGLPVLWDMEIPRQLQGIWAQGWWSNREFLADWFQRRKVPVHLWRTYPTMGFNSEFLSLIGMEYDPLDYPQLSLQLDMYSTNRGLSPELIARILRCGVERYGDRFIPAFGVLNDGVGPEAQFVSPDTLRQDLRLAREAGVAEIWIFGVNGLNVRYVSAIRESLPLPIVSDR